MCVCGGGCGVFGLGWGWVCVEGGAVWCVVGNVMMWRGLHYLLLTPSSLFPSPTAGVPPSSGIISLVHALHARWMESLQHSTLVVLGRAVWSGEVVVARPLLALVASSQSPQAAVVRSSARVPSFSAALLQPFRWCVTQCGVLALLRSSVQLGGASICDANGRRVPVCRCVGRVCVCLCSTDRSTLSRINGCRRLAPTCCR